MVIEKTSWPKLSFEKGKDTYQTLHLWTQIVGKIKLAKLPWVNHSWHVTLSVTTTGFTTSTIMDASNHFQIDFNFIDHKLIITTQNSQLRQFDLKGLSVADFYTTVLTSLFDLGIEVKINPVPSEIANGIPFHEDTMHASYDEEQITSLHHAFLHAQVALMEFRSRFKGKCSPIHLFWGGFDLAVSRFSGRRAPLHPGGVPHLPDWVAQEAYSHEVSSAGFWLGNDAVPFAAFYSYIYPEPEDFKNAVVQPQEAYYHKELREFILPYEAVQQSADPEKKVLEFLTSTYKAAADLAKWERESLET
jgi:hypothetical protein